LFALLTKISLPPLAWSQSVEDLSEKTLLNEQRPARRIEVFQALVTPNASTKNRQQVFVKIGAKETGQKLANC